jgi:glycosyltransferase involved in cell wall biosynthesis
MILYHVITRCTRPQNLLQILDSLEHKLSETYHIQWYVLFDTNYLIEIDSKLLEELYKSDVSIHFIKGNGIDYLYPEISKLVSLWDDGWVVILDDDNLCYPNYFDILSTEILNNKDKLAFVYEQEVNGRDFTGLDIRKVGEQHMKLQHIDSAQYALHVSLHKKLKYESGYDADGRFIEKLYKDNSEHFHFINKVLCYYNALSKESKPRVPKVLYIADKEQELKSVKYADYEDDSLNVLYRDSDKSIESDLVQFKPNSIISISQEDYYQQYKNLCNQPSYVRNKWINLNDYRDREREIAYNVGEIAYNCAMHSMLRADYDMVVSFFTPIYNTKEKLWTTYESVKNQTYPNWEWVIVNDSSDGGKTLKIALEIASKDHRVKVYDFREKSGGIIGESKYRAATLTKGRWLAELDHDDYLVKDCSRYIIAASQKFPDAGFLYTDSVELDENHNSMTYPDGFCFGYGKYRKEKHGDKIWDVVDSANINPKTIRHIVGVPNHIRVWRRDVYFEVGGHNRDLSIADDYELIVRTFLKTKFVRISKLGYLQYIYHNANGRNTHDLSRADIQRRVRSIMYFYNDAINERFKELGVIDYAYEENKDNPLIVESRFGEYENYVNYICNDL